MPVQGSQIGVGEQMLQVTIPNLNGLPQGLERFGVLTQQRIVSRQVVIRDRIVRADRDESPIDLQRPPMATLHREQFAQIAEHVGIRRIAVEDLLEEVDLEVDL